jgi:uncharacterized protein (DUF2236 family)
VFSNDKPYKRVAREGTLLLGGGAALLMQLANPDVASAVRKYSRYKTHPLQRLFGTLMAEYAVTFGSKATSARVEHEISQIHSRVPGAQDPQNVMWVHATLVATAINVYEITVGPLDTSEREIVYQGSRHNASVFGCPLDQQPAKYEDFCEWFEEASQNFVVINDARDVANQLLFGSQPLILRPFRGFNQLITKGLIGERFRKGYGFEWTADDQKDLDSYFQRIRRFTNYTPSVVRALPAYGFAGYAELQTRLNR